MLNIKLDDHGNRLKADFQREFQESNPFTKNSFLGAVLNVMSGTFYTITNMLKYVIKQIFANTAEMEHVRLQAQNRIDIALPMKATGYIGVNVSNITTTIPIGTIVSDILGLTNYQTMDVGVVDVGANLIDYGVMSIIGDNGIVVVTTNIEHMLIDCSITISDATHTSLNGVWDILVTGSHTFTFELGNGSIVNEDMGNTNILILVDRMRIPIQAVLEGVQSNQQPLTPLKFQTTIPNVDSIQVLYHGISGGRDIETAEEYRTRFLNYLRMPQSYFNSHQLKTQILFNFPKVTRVFIEEHVPLTHSIRINCINDKGAITNDLDQVDLDAIKEYVMNIAPINTITEAITVVNVVKVPIVVVVSNIKPNINSLKLVIEADLEDYFTKIQLGENVEIKKLYGVVYSAIDYAGNASVESFDINIQTTIRINEGELAVLDCEVK